MDPGQAFHHACLRIADGDIETRAEMDNLDQIGENRGRQHCPPISAKNTIAVSSSGSLKQVNPLDAEKAGVRFPQSLAKTVVFTRRTSKKMTRDEAKAMAERLGAKVAGSVSQKTDLRGRRPPAPARRLGKAKDLGVAVLSEDEWFDLVPAGRSVML